VWIVWIRMIWIFLIHQALNYLMKNAGTLKFKWIDALYG
jgi:hypothetical protein